VAKRVGWIKDGVQVGPIPGNSVLGGDSLTQLTPREAELQWGEFWELLLLANWCNSSTRSDSKSQIKKWSTSNKCKAKGADLQIVTSCNSNCIFFRKCCMITIYTSLQPRLSRRLNRWLSRIFFRPAANSAAYRRFSKNGTILAHFWGLSYFMC